MLNVLPPLTGARDLARLPGRWCRTVGGVVVLYLVDRLAPVQRRGQLERQIRDSLFAAGRAYEREVLGLPPASTVGRRTGGAAHVAASVDPSSGALRPSPHRRQHLRLV